MVRARAGHHGAIACPAGADAKRVIYAASNALRQALVDLHRTLLDAERRDYERLRGRVSDSEFLDVLVKNPDFGWLGALTTMIVQLDELDADATPDGPERECRARIRKLLIPAAGAGEFNRKYETSLQRNPEVAVAHGLVMRALAAL
jgi:hypothetical protein